MEKNDKIKSMIKDTGILLAITLIAGLMLGFVYELTKEPIRIQKENEVQEACKLVFNEASKFDKMDVVPSQELSNQLSENGVTIGTMFNALNDAGASLGYVVETTSSQGYAGNITVYMGVTAEGVLNGISILEISETPGLGMKAEEILVPQFKDKKVGSFTYTKNSSKSDSEIDAISGATVTTSAITDAVNGGLRIVTEELMNGGSVNE